MLLHSVSDYKKHFYNKWLVDLVLTKKQTLVYFSDPRNSLCRKLFLPKDLRNAHTKNYPSQYSQSVKLVFCLKRYSGSTVSKRFALKLQKIMPICH